MLDPIVSLVTGINDTFRSQLFLPLYILGWTIVGVLYWFGSHRNAQERGIALAIGGALVLGAPKIAAWVQGAIH